MKTHVFFKFCLLSAALALTCSTAQAAPAALDPTFGTNGVVAADWGSATDLGSGLLLQADGKILLFGFASLNPEDPYELTPVVARYANNGALDSAFGAGGKLTLPSERFSRSQFALQADGKILAAKSLFGNFTLARYQSDGTPDLSFGENGTAVLNFYGDSTQTLSDFALQPDGKILAAGYHQLSGSNFIDFIVARFNPDGSMDDSFVANGFIILDKTDFPNNRYNYGKALAVQPDGKIIVSGNMMDDNGETQLSLVRLLPDGYPEKTGFGTNGKGTVMIPLPGFRHGAGAIVLQPDGKFIVAGTIYDEEQNVARDAALIRFNADGSLDSSFGGTGIVVLDLNANETCADIRLQADGKIILAGTRAANDAPAMFLARLNADGSPDSSFGEGGWLLGEADSSLAGIEIQPDGKILAVGSFHGDALLARYNVPLPTQTAAFQSVGAYDGGILEYAEFKNAGGSLDKLGTTFFVGDALRDRQYIGVLSFNTAALPDNAAIVAARLRIKKQGQVGTDPFSTHGALNAFINNRAFSNNVGLQLSDFNAPAAPASEANPLTPEAEGWYAANLSAVNLGFVNKTGVTQFRLAFALDDNDDLNADYLKFFSGNSAVQRPQLLIEYYAP